MKTVTLTIPVHTTTPGNNRQHWAVEARKARSQRDASCLIVKCCNDRPDFPVKVSLTRISPRSMDRHNLPGALKHCVDGIADAYGVDDGDNRWVFEFNQRKGKHHLVEIVLTKIGG